MSRQNGTVHLELSKVQRTEEGELWRAHLYLVEGYVACHVHSQVDGRRLLSDGEAMRWLARWGQREFVWSLEMFTLQQITPHPVPAGLLPPARHVALLQRVSQLADLPTVRYDPPYGAVGSPLPTSHADYTSTTDRASRTGCDQFVAPDAQADLRSVDGTRSIRQIAVMLKQPPTVVEEIVNGLQSLGVIRR